MTVLALGDLDPGGRIFFEVEVVKEAQATRKITVAEHTIMTRAAYLDLLRCVLWVSIRQGNLSRKQ